MDADAVSVIVSAVSAGAAAGAKATAAQAVKDAYAAFKTLITGRYGTVDVTPVADKPESAPRRAVLAEDLDAAGAGADEELVAAAHHLLTLIDQHDRDVARVVGVDISGLKAANVRFSDISAHGPGATGLRAHDITATGDFTASHVHASSEPPPQDPSPR